MEPSSQYIWAKEAATAQLTHSTGLASQMGYHHKGYEEEVNLGPYTWTKAPGQLARTKYRSQATGGIRTFQVKERESVRRRVKLVNSVSGRTICFPGVTTKDIAWTLDARKLEVGQLVGQAAYSVDNDCIDYESFSAIVALLTGNKCAPLSFELLDCAQGTGSKTDTLSVEVICGEDPIPFTALDYEEKPCYPDIDDTGTPPTPT